MTSQRSRPAYIALLSVLMIGAIASTVVVILFTTSITSVQNADSTQSGKIARLLADACMEIALQSLTDCNVTCVTTPGASTCDDSSSACPTTISTLTTGNCDIELLNNPTGTTWYIQTEATVRGSTRRFEVKADKQDGVAATVEWWKECIDLSAAPCPKPS